jgi:hypothetical protein
MRKIRFEAPFIAWMARGKIGQFLPYRDHQRRETMQLTAPTWKSVPEFSAKIRIHKALVNHEVLPRLKTGGDRRKRMQVKWPMQVRRHD